MLPIYGKMLRFGKDPLKKIILTDRIEQKIGEKEIIMAERSNTVMIDVILEIAKEEESATIAPQLLKKHWIIVKSG